MTTRQMHRRTLARLSLGGLTLIGSRAKATSADESIQAPSLPHLGANALARAADRSYFADGHRGAALVAADVLITQTNLSDEGSARIRHLLEQNWAATELCKDFPVEDPVTDPSRVVGLTLAEGGSNLREVGHDVIFAMHAMHVFRTHPHLATPQRVEGVCRLLKSIKPWRDNPADPTVQPPPFSDARLASRFVLREALQAVPRFSGFGQGFAGHMLTFGQALIEMAATGGEEWAEACRTAFCKYVTVTRQGPAGTDRKIADHKPSVLRPNQTDYWKNRGERTLGLGHVFKYPAAYYELLDHAQDPDLQQDFEEQAWQIF